MNASDFKNTPQWPITYWHKGGVSQPLDVSVGMVSPQLASGTNNCPSKFGGVGSMQIGQGMAAQTMNELILAKQAWQNTAYVHASLIDGGNTPALVQQVQESWPYRC